MKALVPHGYSIDALRIEDIPDPSPSDGQVLIRTKAAGLNALDWRVALGEPWFIRGFTGLRRPSKVPVMGADVAGIVESVGPGVTDFQPGDAVFAEVGIRGMGGISELSLVDADTTAMMPDCSFEEAAALPVAGVTSTQGLRDHGKLQAGERVAITGASGGVGHLAVQVAKQYGAHVTAVTSRPDMVAKLGADEVLGRDEWLNQQYDIIFENAGHRPLRDYQPALLPGGRMVLVGGSGKAMLAAMLSRRAISFTAQPRRQDLEELASMVDAGLHPVVEAIAMEQAAAGIQRLRDGKVAGKLVVRI